MMWIQSPTVVLMMLSASLPSTVVADTFLGSSKTDRRVVSAQARSEELQAALGAVLGCTGGSGASVSQRPNHMTAIRRTLLPVWQSLPKNQHGRVEWRLLRYVAHRHFMQRFHVLVRGLEPTILLNASQLGDAEILSRQAPALAQQLTGPHVQHGFSLEDAVAMVVALEQLLFDSDSALLEKIYKNKGFASHADLNKNQLAALLKDYMVYWMIDDDEMARQLLKNQQVLRDSIPHWTSIIDMVEGSVKAFEFSRQRELEPGAGHVAFEGRYTFEDALEVAGSIGRSFGPFWETQCQDTKSSLLALDKAGTGRVRLPDFYGANKEGEWRFGESEVYLREIGALDETSVRLGNQVIVANYMQAASNCVVTRSHYLVCCMIECEWIQSQVEAAIGGPMATAEVVWEVAGNVTVGSDEPARLDDAMRERLERIAQVHGGKVPLHGRLFAQWLHYAFPHECAFPFKAGEKAALTPVQFGDESIVTPEEVNKRVAEDIVQRDLGGNTSEQSQFMIEWSEEEELLSDYSQHLSESWDRKPVFVIGASAALIGLLWANTGKQHEITSRTHSV